MLISKLLAFPAAVMLALNSAGIDMDYEGAIDPFSGLPVSSSNEENAQQTVYVSDGVSYDRNTHMFSYMIPDKSGSVKSSVADGMITTDRVSIEIPSGFAASLFRDGEELVDTDYSEVAASGSYALVVTGTDAQYQLFAFTIVNEKTGAIDSYRLPSGFKLTQLVLDGNSQGTVGKESVDLTTEGYYNITTRCNATGVDYNLNVEIDHTPPMIALEGVSSEGEAHSAVTISGVAPEDSVWLSYEDKQISVPDDYKLTSPGKYYISVTDDAGNVFSQSFEIKFYLNMQGLIFTLLAVGVAAAVFLYMYISKRRLKVR